MSAGTTMGLSIAADEDVVIARGLKSRLRREIARMIKAAARRERFADIAVLVRLCSDHTMHRLHCHEPGNNERIPLLVILREEAAGIRGPVGDIVISVPTANRQAKHGLHAELLRLSACGLCGLLGYSPDNEEAELALAIRAAALRREALRGGHVRAA